MHNGIKASMEVITPGQSRGKKKRRGWREGRDGVVVVVVVVVADWRGGGETVGAAGVLRAAREGSPAASATPSSSASPSSTPSTPSTAPQTPSLSPSLLLLCHLSLLAPPLSAVRFLRSGNTTAICAGNTTAIGLHCSTYETCR